MCKIIITTGGTCSGKSSLIKKVCRESTFIIRAKTCTTRDIREGLESIDDYYFLSKEEFKEKESNHEFIETYEDSNGNRYGLLKSELDLESNNVYLIAMNKSGVDNICYYLREEGFSFDNLYHIHVYANALTRLKRIINNRRLKSDNEVYKYCQRMLEGKEEEENLIKDSDLILINDTMKEKEKNEIFLEVFCRSILK